MSVTSRELHSVGSSGSVDAKSITYTAKYRCYVNSGLDQAKTILEYFYANGPWIGDEFAYGNDSGELTYCDSISVPNRVTGTTDVWEVDVHYKTPDNSGDSSKTTGGALTTNPLDFRAEISFGYTHFREPVTKGIYRGGFTHAFGVNGAVRVLDDGDEAAITNSAWEPYDPPLERDGQYGVWRIKSNHETFETDQADFFINTVNVFDLTIQPWIPATGTIKKFCGKIVSIEGNLKKATIFSQSLEYYEVMVEIHVNKKTWRESVLDRGFHKGAWPGAPDGRGGTISQTDIPEGVPHLAAIVDNDGLPIQKPCLLNGAGFPKVASDATIYAAKWQIYDEYAWTTCPYISPGLKLA